MISLQTSFTPAHPLLKDTISQLTASYAPFTITLSGDTRQVYARHLYGLERYGAIIAEAGMGYSHYTGGISVTFASHAARVLKRDTVLAAIRRAWIRARHLCPNLASRTFGIPDPAVDCSVLQDDDARVNEGYYFVYEVPRVVKDIEAWADETLRIHSEYSADLRTMEAALSGYYWKPADGRYNVELHVAQDHKLDWLLFLSGPHYSVDGRCSYMILDELLRFIVEDLSNAHDGAVSLDSLVWGAEVERLSPAAGLAMRATVPDAAHDGVDCWALDKPSADDPSKSSSLKQTPFLRPRAPIIMSDVPPAAYRAERTFPRPQRPLAYPNLSSTVIFSKEETTAFRNVCKSRGRTVTAVIDAILMLSELEVTMRQGGTGSGKHASNSDIKKLYDNSTAMSASKVTDMRSAMPAEHASLHSKYSTPPFSIHMALHSHPMGNLRKAISVTVDSSGNMEVIPNFSDATFWDGVVQDSADVWKTKRPSPQEFSHIQAVTDAALPNVFNPAMLLVPSTSISSPGDLDALGRGISAGEYGLLGRWNESVRGPLPSNLEATKADARIKDLTLTIRTHSSSTLMWEVFTYDGKLRLHLAGSSGRSTQDYLDEMTRTAREWVGRVLRA